MAWTEINDLFYLLLGYHIPFTMTENISHASALKRGNIGEKEGNKVGVLLVTVLLNKILFLFLTANGLLNLWDIKF